MSSPRKKESPRKEKRERSTSTRKRSLPDEKTKKVIQALQKISEDEDRQISELEKEMDEKRKLAESESDEKRKVLEKKIEERRRALQSEIDELRQSLNAEEREARKKISIEADQKRKQTLEALAPPAPPEEPKVPGLLFGSISTPTFSRHKDELSPTTCDLFSTLLKGKFTDVAERGKYASVQFSSSTALGERVFAEGSVEWVLRYEDRNEVGGLFVIGITKGGQDFDASSWREGPSYVWVSSSSVTSSSRSAGAWMGGKWHEGYDGWKGGIQNNDILRLTLSCDKHQLTLEVEKKTEILQSVMTLPNNGPWRLLIELKDSAVRILDVKRSSTAPKSPTKQSSS